MAEALLLKRPSSGWVESVSTLADHFFFVCLRCHRCLLDRCLLVCRMRAAALFLAALAEEVGEQGAALFGEQAGVDVDAGG